MDKAIITAAITGFTHTPSMSPYLPITPEEISAEAVRAWEAGAAVAHIHVREPKTGKPSWETELFREVAVKVKSKCDIVLCFSTGGGKGMTPEQRLAAITSLKPELATFNFGSISVALFPILDRYKEFKFEWEKPFIEMTEDLVVVNTFKTLKTFAQVFETTETKPEIEIYNVGMLNNLAFFIERGIVKKPVYMQFVLGVPGGLSATVENLVFLLNTAKSSIGDFTFSVCAAGRYQFPMCVHSLLCGGNARVGLEDNLYLQKGVLAKSNAEQVEKIIRIARELGIEPTTPSEARNILGLKGIHNVNF